jgi:hypothetical protein
VTAPAEDTDEGDCGAAELGFAGSEQLCLLGP